MANFMGGTGRWNLSDERDRAFHGDERFNLRTTSSGFTIRENERQRLGVVFDGWDKIG